MKLYQVAGFQCAHLIVFEYIKALYLDDILEAAAVHNGCFTSPMDSYKMHLSF